MNTVRLFNTYSAISPSFSEGYLFASVLIIVGYIFASDFFIVSFIEFSLVKNGRFILIFSAFSKFFPIKSFVQE